VDALAHNWFTPDRAGSHDDGSSSHSLLEDTQAGARAPVSEARRANQNRLKQKKGKKDDPCEAK
jgi:hypothetical protein